MSLHKVNVGFIIRALLLALPVAALATVVGFVLLVTRGWPPAGPIPPPPAILAPRGELPAGPVGVEDGVQVQGGSYNLAGSGFLIVLDEGEAVGVTTAHSVPFGAPARPLERIALRVAGQPDFVAEFDTLWGHPGRLRTGGDMTVDCVLMKTDQSLDASLLLTPDPRGAPQPGERVSLFSGLGDGHGGRRVLEGTVQSVSDTAAWVAMDGWFSPGLMSGSPVVSRHTGQAVGMAIAVSLQRYRLLLGIHPIGSIVRLAESATEFPVLPAY